MSELRFSHETGSGKTRQTTDNVDADKGQIRSVSIVPKIVMKNLIENSIYGSSSVDLFKLLNDLKTITPLSVFCSCVVTLEALQIQCVCVCVCSQTR